MSGYLNRVQLIGNLGRDPEVRTTQGGKRLVTLSIATAESWRDAQSGDRVERTEWHRIVIWNEGLGTLAEKYLVKGSKVFLEGKLVTNKFTDNDGVERYSTEVHLTPYNGTLTFLDSKKSDGRTQTGTTPQRERDREPAMAGAGAGPQGGGDLDDEIPFWRCFFWRARGDQRARSASPLLTTLSTTEAAMTAIFGAPARAHLYATLKDLLQLPGKPGRTVNTATASFDAQAEGWDVFDCGLRDDGAPRVELQRLDSPPCGTRLFRSDEDAWQHVVRQARAGSIPHQRALQTVDPVERLAIEAKCGWCLGL